MCNSIVVADKMNFVRANNGSLTDGTVTMLTGTDKMCFEKEFYAYSNELTEGYNAALYIKT